ncbi:hypothetical protein P7K49_025284 [Saguinus oedipus]|uniref:MYND-type domain-containing protein n=1 Tax=Saguinus oedipus TaxID=9490 RepID=A0ABQ9UHJ6_SAGOE|nr:hypothetical protein P7K49_025284 [Saguinus oedipus]
MTGKWAEMINTNDSENTDTLKNKDSWRSYKGKLDMCKLLLRHGADVNCHQHEHGYTALMFAALSGNKDITWVMLEAGADTDVVNSVGRTAAQMAAFVVGHLTGSYEAYGIYGLSSSSLVSSYTVVNFPAVSRVDFDAAQDEVRHSQVLPGTLKDNQSPLPASGTRIQLAHSRIPKQVTCSQQDQADAPWTKHKWVGATQAAQGQHDCVTIINNFFPRERLDYYTKPQGLDKEPKLPPKLAGPLHKIITTTNLHPVKTSLFALFGRASDGFPVYQEKIIRESIRKFPYCEATLLQQLVRSIAPVEILLLPYAYCGTLASACHKAEQEVRGIAEFRKIAPASQQIIPLKISLLYPLTGSDPTAFSVLTQAITGQVGFVDVEFCTTCGEKGASKRCSVCKMVIYCDQTCQKTHWFTHKKICKNLKDIYEKQQLEAAKEKRREENYHKLDVNSNCVNEEQPEDEVGVSQKDSNPKDSGEEEKESLESEAGLEGLQKAPAGPQVSEE